MYCMDLYGYGFALIVVKVILKGRKGHICHLEAIFSKTV